MRRCEGIGRTRIAFVVVWLWRRESNSAGTRLRELMRPLLEAEKGSREDVKLRGMEIGS